MPNIAFDALYQTNPSLSQSYAECLINLQDSISNMSDVRVVLASLPKDFQNELIVELYRLADEVRVNPEGNQDLLTELSSKTRDISKVEFIPEFNHNINMLVKTTLLGSKSQQWLNDRQDFLSQYGDASLFKEAIKLQKN